MFFISRRIKTQQRVIVTQTAELAGSTTETLRNVELTAPYMHNGAFKTLDDYSLSKIGPPRSLYLGNFVTGLRDGQFFMWLGNSAVLAVASGRCLLRHR